MSENPKPDPQHQYYVNLLGRDLTWQEAWFPSTIMEDDKGKPIQNYWDWKRSGGNDESLYRKTAPPDRSSTAKPASPAPARNSAKTTPGIRENPPRPAIRSNIRHVGNDHYTLECAVDNNGRLKTKLERSNFFNNHYQYVYDSKGHLIRVFLNGRLAEEYEYNEQGQRTQQYSAHNPPAVYLRYNAKGQLIAQGDTRFEYDKFGALSRKIYDPPHGVGYGETRYFYNGDTRLDKVILPSGDEITWKYGRGEDMQAQNPLRKFRNGALVMEYQWRDPFRLAACFNHEKGLEFRFRYGERLCPESVLIREHKNKRVAEAELLCGCDQVGTLRTLSFAPNKLLNYIDYDSFGNMLPNAITNKLPRLQTPIGFAGGLIDYDTGLVRFGYRDYDPSCGRFTCPDPLGDTGGDHDLYDYCVDDPVSSKDSTGLFVGAILSKPGEWILKQFAKGLGKKIGVSFFNDKVNEDEELIDVRNRINETEEKIQNGIATEKEIQRLKKDKKRENELWGNHGKFYRNNEFYSRYYTDKGEFENRSRLHEE